MEGYCAVACLGLADGRDVGDITGGWLVWYDPAGNNGNGDAAWSHDPADAARFTDREWAELWTAAPANRPMRPDGKPNRPITMLNLLIVPVRPGELPTIPPVPEAVSPEPPAETEAEFRARLARMVAAAAARQPAEKLGPSSPPRRQPTPEREPDPDKPDLSQPGALTESLRAMGPM
jgi:hypothetical protein